MGLSWRKSKKLGPFRLNASRRGVSGTVGFGPFRIGKRGWSLRLPGGFLWTSGRKRRR